MEHRRRTLVIADLLVAAAAAIGRLPSLGAWWNQDDWGLLARAAGLIAPDGAPARWLSRDLYWRICEPLFGFSPQPWAVTRVLLHAAASVLVARLARRAGGGPLAGLVAGLLFAASPLAFTPLYWASGIQELLAAALGLLCVELLLAGGVAATLAAVSSGLLAMLAKESALGLPLFAAALAVWGDPARRRARWGAAAVLLPAAVVAAVWSLRAFPHAPGHAYAIGPAAAPAANLAQYGWWMISPWPVFPSRFTLPIGLGGVSIWALWTAWARHRWREDDRAPAAALLAALLALAPVLPLRYHVLPYLAYAAFAPAAIVLAVAFLRDRTLPRPAPTLLIAVAAAAVAWGGMEIRLTRRDARGLPADPLVLRTAVSHEALAALHTVPVGSAGRLTILQPPCLHPGPAGSAIRDLPAPTVLWSALAGDLGPELLGPEHVDVTWARSLAHVRVDATVMLDDGVRLLYWGHAKEAFLDLTLTQIGTGHAAEAAATLEAGLRGSLQSIAFVLDLDQLPVGLDAIRRGAPSFLAAVDGADLPPDEHDALAATARGLLKRCGVPAD